MIGFNKPYLTGKELLYIEDAVATRKLSGNGKYTSLCHSFFENRYGFRRCLLTTSCTDALEMAALLLRIAPGDEVIMPSYTFVSTANAFVLRGARIIFADSREDHPGIDEKQIELLVTPKTKAIVVVHYAGVACDMDPILALAEKHGLFVIEDAAQAIDSFYKGQPLGGIGALSTFSFHETKNVQCGEGGMLVINENEFVRRAEVLHEKGTNRAAFFRGEIDKYSWVDIGSSFLPSEIISAFLFAQLENLDAIQKRRLAIWNQYAEGLNMLGNEGKIGLPVIPRFATNNAHMFYILCSNLHERTELIAHMKRKECNPVFHYLSLHSSPYFSDQYEGGELKNSDRYSDCLLRLPLYYELTPAEVEQVIGAISSFYQ